MQGIAAGGAVTEVGPQCSRQLLNSKFDTAFRMPDATERLCFDIPAALCKDCRFGGSGRMPP